MMPPPALTQAAPAAGARWSDLAAQLDVDELRRALDRELPRGARPGWQIAGLEVLAVRRSSSRQRDPHPITLHLEARLSDGAGSALGTQWWFAKAYRDGGADAALADARAAATAPPAFGEPVAAVPALGMLVWAWPNDPVLTQLPRLLDRATVASHLPADPLHGAPEVRAIEVLRYRPEQRATLRCELRPRARNGLHMVVGKTFADDRAGALLGSFDHFWRAGAADLDAAMVAEPLGVCRTTRTLWQRAVHGVPLLERWRRESAPRDFAAVGRALARLHAAPLVPGPQRSTDWWLAEIDGRCRKLARAAPALADRAQALADALHAAAARLPARTPTLIHGDCHPGQMWIAGPRVVLFDFDELALGDPMEDLADFGVKLEQAGLPPARCRALEQSLHDAYRADAPAAWSEAWLRWHRAVRSLVQASRAFVFQPPDWPQRLVERLARAEALAQEIEA